MYLGRSYITASELPIFIIGVSGNTKYTVKGCYCIVLMNGLGHLVY